ncbi:MAG: hypothetical protein ABW186_18660 [Rhodanobacteraceae bacterium]
MRRTITLRLASTVVAVSLTGVTLPVAAAIPPAERNALVALYLQTDGGNWIRNDAWNGAPGTECTWYGITCDESDSHVSAIDLHDNALTGMLPDFTRFTELVQFDVSRNSLSGPLPPFAGMRALEVVSVANNQLDGQLPTLAALDSLTTFLVNDNRFTGRIPSFQHAPMLVSIDVSHNSLSGSIPDLAELSHLEAFGARDDGLTGPLPALPDSGTLRFLNVMENSLTGRLPQAPPGPLVAFLCPNAFAPVPDADWDVLVGVSPWYLGCSDAHVNLDQFGVGGSWYDPDHSGQGIVLSAMPYLDAQGHGLLFGGWFTFTPQASGEPAAPHWFSIQGEVGTGPEATLGLYETTGGRFDDAPMPTTQLVGSALLYLADCERGVLQYHFDDGRVPDGSYYISRLVPSETCTPTGANPPPAHNSMLSGAWYDPEHSGQGLTIDLEPSQGVLFAAWYTFAADATEEDAATSQRWYSMQTRYESPDATSFDDVPIFAPQPGVFVGPVNDPVVQVGTARFEFEGCNTLTVDYTFDAPDARAGTLHLVRLGPEPAACE